jgi:hypothetical protein
MNDRYPSTNYSTCHMPARGEVLQNAQSLYLKTSLKALHTVSILRLNYMFSNRVKDVKNFPLESGQQISAFFGLLSATF